MTIITHNAPREGEASLGDNISHKYAKRLLSFIARYLTNTLCFSSRLI